MGGQVLEEALLCVLDWEKLSAREKFWEGSKTPGEPSYGRACLHRVGKAWDGGRYSKKPPNTSGDNHGHCERMDPPPPPGSHLHFR